MDIELFKNTYTPTMMRIIKKFAERLEQEIIQDVQSDNHHIIVKAKYKIDDLAQAKMLLSVYEACPICMEINCQSDHK